MWISAYALIHTVRVSRKFARSTRNPATDAADGRGETDKRRALARGTQLGGELFFKPESEWDLETIAKGREALALELARFEHELRGENLVYELSASDFTLYPWLALAFRMGCKKPDLGIGSRIGASLSDWMRRIEALPYFEKTNCAFTAPLIIAVLCRLTRPIP